MSDTRDTSRAQPYHPVCGERAEKLRAWHERAYAESARSTATTVTYLGQSLYLLPSVFAPTPTSDLLGNAVLAEVREQDRVLDMGTGSGANAILAASRAREVFAVDINPEAVECARRNAQFNGVGERVACAVSDLFSAVRGKFDLIVFDPPFRWFKPRDMRERATADENYAALTTFFTESDDHLADGGRILLFFGTSGDYEYLNRLIDTTGYGKETVATRTLQNKGERVQYFTYRLTKQ